MGIRYWMKKRMAGEEGDLPPDGSLMESLFGTESPTRHALGEYTADNYPKDVVDLLRRRQEVADALLDLEATDRQGRIDAIPRLKELLRIYPHALVYETLIHAFIADGRWDDAKGVAFAARERRHECMRSNLPELRAEVDYLSEWNTEEIDRLREERTGG